MKITTIFVLLFASVLLWTNGCCDCGTPIGASTVLPSVVSIQYNYFTDGILTNIIVRKDEIILHTEFVTTIHDTIVADNHELEFITTTFDIPAFWLLQDKIDQAHLNLDGALITLTVTKTDKTLKILKFTDNTPHPETTGLLSRINALIKRIEHK
jgi:hypothetical protein